MPEITDPLPQDFGQVFGRLVAGLGETIPPRHLDRNLLVATWNLRAFGRVTEKWRTPRGQLEKTFADIRVLIERHATLAARRCASTRVEHEQPRLGEKVDSRGAQLHVPGDHAR